jgi:hypothetical protein
MTTTTEFRTWPQYGWNYTNRFIGRCLPKHGGCGAVVRLLDDRSGEEFFVTCPECQSLRRVKVSRVAGLDSSKECNARCTGATGPSCECKCRGENHGGR